MPADSASPTSPDAQGRWHTLLAIDFERRAAETYKANFSGVDVRCASVADEIERLPDADVILGGPPCQPHSFAGKRGASADKRDCGPDFVAAIARVKPRMFLMENVEGLMSSEGGRYATRLLTAMESAGYVVQVRVLDAVAFGVPQFRVRCWWWGIRRDVYREGVRYVWPVATHAWPPPAQGLDLFGGEPLSAGVTVREALGLDGSIIRYRGVGWGERRAFTTAEPSMAVLGAGNGEGGSTGAMYLRSHADPAVTIDRPSPSFRSGGAGHDGCCLRIIGGGRNHPADENGVYLREKRDITDEPCTTIVDYNGSTTPSIRAVPWRWSDDYLAKHPPVSPDAPASTVKAQWAKGVPNGVLDVSETMTGVRWKQGTDGLWVRRLTPLECARLQSVPDDFRWPDGMTKTAAYRVIGNGWASEMSRHMSEAMATADPDSRTVIDLFCGGGLGAVGWHGRSWRILSRKAVPHAVA